MEKLCPNCQNCYDDSEPMCPYCSGYGNNSSDEPCSEENPVRNNQPPVGYGAAPGMNGQPPMGYGAAPGMDGQPPAGYGAGPGMNGQPPAGYGAAPGMNGQPPAGYGAGPGMNGQPPAGYGAGYGMNGQPPAGYGAGYGMMPPPPPKKKKTGLVIGIVAAVVAVVLLLIVIVVVLIFKRPHPDVLPVSETESIPVVDPIAEGTTAVEFGSGYPSEREITVSESGYYILTIKNTDSVYSGTSAYVNLFVNDTYYEPLAIDHYDAYEYTASGFTDRISVACYLDTANSNTLMLSFDDTEVYGVSYTTILKKATDLAQTATPADEFFYCFTAPADGCYMFKSDDCFTLDDEEAIGYQKNISEFRNAHFISARVFTAGETATVVPAERMAVQCESTTKAYCDGVALYREYCQDGLYLTTSAKLYESTTITEDYNWFTESATRNPVGFEVKDSTLWLAFEATDDYSGQLLVYYPVDMN